MGDPAATALRAAAQVQIYLTLMLSNVLMANPTAAARDTVDFLLILITIGSTTMLFAEELFPWALKTAKWSEKKAIEQAHKLRDRYFKKATRTSNEMPQEEEEEPEFDDAMLPPELQGETLVYTKTTGEIIVEKLAA